MPHPPLADLVAKMEPEAIRRSLVRVGLFIAGYEFLKGEIVDKARGFFVCGFDEEGQTTNPAYEMHVRALHKKEFDACLLWLVSMDGLTEQQADRVRAVRAHRNDVAHALPTYIVNPGTDVDLALLREMRDLIARLGQFWGSIELSINPDFDDAEDDVEVLSGTLVMMDHLIAAAEGAGS